MTTANLLEIDPDKLFEKCSIEEIIEIDKKLQIEIEKKRTELRSMVSDRYQDIITASDAIKTMQSTASSIAEHINSLFGQFDALKHAKLGTNDIGIPVKPNPEENELRAVAIQIRIITFLPEHIWSSLDDHDYSTAAQFYLLAQHIFTGLLLDTKHNIPQKMPIVQRLQLNINKFRDKIFKGINENLQRIDLSDSAASSYLNAFLLLEHKTNKDLLTTFVDLRKKALINVIESPHRSVRVQVLEMTKCLIRTFQLLHSCFIGFGMSNVGLIWMQLNDVVGENAPTTLSKMSMPSTPMLTFLPEIVAQFRPKYINSENELTVSEITASIIKWLEWTTETVRDGLEKSLELVTNVKALSILREEALKIEIPNNWNQLCQDTNLPKKFDVWNYFFQPSVTKRAQQLISKQVNENINSIQTEVQEILQTAILKDQFEGDIRWYTWYENPQDVSRDENKHTGLSMKTKGYTFNIVNLCEKIDKKFNELLQDISVYVYGSDVEKEWLKNNLINEENDKLRANHCSDRQLLESHLRNECCKQLGILVEFLFTTVNSEKNSKYKVTKAIVCARFLQAISLLCSNLSKCCSRGDKSDKWEDIMSTFKEDSLKLWEVWLNSCLSESEVLAEELMEQSSFIKMLNVLPKWEAIEIQEQTEDKVFETQIKIPSQPSILLQQFLNIISRQLNAVIPHTLPKLIHLRFIESNMSIILEQYASLVANDKLQNVNQTQALQFLLDVKFVTLLGIPRENMELINKSRDICDNLRSRVDPFDLDVFYEYLQSNVRRCVFNSQVILGCLLPNSGQLANLGIADKQMEKEPSILAVSIPANNTWFPLLPVTAPVQKSAAHITVNTVRPERNLSTIKQQKPTKKSNNEATSSVRSGAAALFGAMTTDWFS